MRAIVPAGVAAVLLITGIVTGVPSSAATTKAPTRYRVGVADYTLGDRAFTYPGLYRDPEVGPKSGRAPIELTGRVFYPRARGRHPMVIMLHGSWETCADRAAGLRENQAVALENAWDAAHPGDKAHPGAPNPDQAKLDRIIDAAARKLNRWPCAKGTPALPSYTGYDYLGRSLASHGITAVSISANGINSVGLGDVAVAARAALINKHLALWAALDRTGRGALAGRFTRPGSTTRVHPNFRHSVDLNRVGTLGHSRGGKAVFWQAADSHTAQLPKGVHVRAMVSLAPEGAAEAEPGTAAARNYRVSRLPFLLWEGTCDFATGRGGDDYLAVNAGRNRSPHYQLVVHGANHNFLNTQWSPSSGQVVANDDVDTPGIPRPVPGSCTDEDGSRPELGESAERNASRTYVTAFFLRELLGQRRWESVLTGKSRPLGKHVGVDIHVTRATR